MKKKYIFGLAMASVLMASCSDDIMDRINSDEKHPSSGVVNAVFQLTDAEVATAYSIINGNYAWYVSSYTEQLFGTGNNQLKQVEVRNASEIAATSTFNNEWNATYLNLNNIKIIRDKCQKGGVNANQTDVLGMAQALEALNLGVLTDMHGDIPYSESFKSISAPKIDSQESIYNRIFELLDSAQINFAQGGNNVGTQDVLFKGDVSKWVAFVHALKARYLLHTYGVNKSVLSRVLEEAEAAANAGFNGCTLNVFNGVTADNSWSAYHWSRFYIGSSTTVDNLMLERNDPREPIYNFDAFETGIIGEPGNERQAILTEAIAYPLWLDNGAAYLHLFSKSELYFILAEVKARLNMDAKADFETAVMASMDDYAVCADVEFSDEEVAGYLETIAQKFAENPLNEIFVQKYIAQTRDEQLETYNDMRRCNFTDGSYAVKMTNPANTQSGNNRWPLRLPYGESDVVSNPNVSAAFGTGNDAGMYIYNSPVWWAGGSK